MKLELSIRNACENWNQCQSNVIEATLALVYDLADLIHVTYFSCLEKSILNIQILQIKISLYL